MFCLSCLLALLSALAGIGVALCRLATSRYWPIAALGLVCLAYALWKVPDIVHWLGETKLIPCASSQCTSDTRQH